MRNKVNIVAPVLAIAAGMGGELHLQIPSFGTIAMLDLASYFLAIPILLLLWAEMGKYMRRSLYWAFAWTAAAMLSNAFNFYEMKYWCKCVSLASSSWAIMAAAYLLLRKYPNGYLWYLVGAGIGGWIALYHFRNGAYEVFANQGEESNLGVGNLLEKQVYPFVAQGVLYGFILPLFIWWKKMPIFLVLVATVFAGYWLLLHGGSRSGFGLFCAAAGAGFVVVYSSRVFRKVAKRPIFMLVLVGIGGGIVFGGYKMMANSGAMGEGERQKYENEFGEGGRGAVTGRAGFDVALQDAKESFWIGKGCHLRNHSVMANALACDGVFGFLFWLYFYLQVFWWVCKRMPYSGKNTSFIMLMVLSACWAAFGSPFGTRHKFFMLMTFIALSRDSPYYGAGSIYSNTLIPVWKQTFARR